MLAGFVAAHMISNLSNDYFGFRRGHDTPDSPRMRYTVHPLASGVLETRTLVTGLAILGALGIAIAAAFIVERGWTAVGFTAAGVALLFLYDAAPTPLKSVGLGELATLVVGGPLMIGGGYAMITGELSAGAMLASIPYGLGVMSILTGKHIDQMSFELGPGHSHVAGPDRGGRGAAPDRRRARLHYLTVAALILAGALTPFAAAVLVALPRAYRAIGIVSRPRPATAPPGYVGWPLWFHRACLVHNRLFGWAYIGGLAAGVVWRMALH